MPHEIRKISNFQRKLLPDWQVSAGGWVEGDSHMSGCEPPVRQTVRGRSMFKSLPADLALVSLLTLLCIPFVLAPPLNETPVRIVLGFLLVLFLPGYSLIAALFPANDDLDLDGTRADRTRASGLGYRSRAAACRALDVHGLACRGRRCAEAGAS